MAIVTVKQMSKVSLLAQTLVLRSARQVLDKHSRIEDRALFLKEAAEVLRQMRLIMKEQK